MPGGVFRDRLGLYGYLLRSVRKAELVPTSPPREPRFVDPDDNDMRS